MARRLPLPLGQPRSLGEALLLIPSGWERGPLGPLTPVQNPGASYAKFRLGTLGGIPGKGPQDGAAHQERLLTG